MEIDYNIIIILKIAVKKIKNGKKYDVFVL